MNEKHITGEIPWNEEELIEILDLIAEIGSKPKDDWDLNTEVILTLEDKNGKRFNKKLNKFNLTTQASICIFKLYENFNEEIALSHVCRFFKIMQFVKKYQNKLLEKNLMDSKGNVDKKILKTLCNSRYNKKELDEDNDEIYNFDYKEILNSAGFKED